MRDQSDKIKKYILSNVAEHTIDIVNITMAKFAVTSTTVHRHISSLTKQGLLVKSGKTRSAKYFLKDSYTRSKTYSIDKNFAEDKIFDEFNDIFKRLPKNIYDICYFGVTEMLNNAIDHSSGSNITIATRFIEPHLIITVTDDGVGVFKTICDALHISDLREGILHLSKGKVTRDPINHSGQGIFFTSRMFNTFSIHANTYIYTRDNFLRDWTFVQQYGNSGTEIAMTMNVHTQTTCRKIFAEFEGEDYAFDRTEILVHLCNYDKDSFVSRSQAKSILMELDKFSLITFDFKKIQFVGQGFVDEIFRVFKSKHPQIKIQYVNAIESVRFMIERCIQTKQ